MAKENPRQPYPLAFTTLACPDWSWAQIVERAVSYGYQGIELRGVEGEMDLTRAAPFTADRLAATKRELDARNLAIPCVDTSCRFHDADQIAAALDEGKRHIDLAAALDSPAIRVFGDRLPDAADTAARERVIAQVADGVLQLARHAEGTKVWVLLESHGDFARIDDLVATLQQAQHPQVGVLWDVHHPFRFFGEPLAETFGRLKTYIRHVHLKDSVMTGDNNVRYTLQGTGDLPTGEVLRILHQGSYAGWISLEWEKRWHPEIEEPEVALPGFISVMREAENALATAASGS